MSIFIALLFTFLIGSIPTAYIMGRLKGIDIRRVGSGNVGATNAFRILGKNWGIACLVFDIFKGFLPVAVLFSPKNMDFFAHAELWQWAVGLTAIAGHMFSPFLRFRGGKGVATSLGVVLAIAPWPVLIVFLLGVTIIFTTGYVSVASITGAILLPILILAFGWSRPPWASFIVTLLLGIMIVWKHRANIRRLCEGTEKRLFQKNGGRAADIRARGERR